MNRAKLLIVLIMSVAGVVTLWSLSSGFSTYTDLKTARRAGEPVQVRGIILRGARFPQYYDTQINALRFWMRDRNNETIEVVYHGAKPDAFDTAPGTVARGMVQKDASGRESFVADNLVIQCPSKYSDEKARGMRKPRGSTI